MWLFHVKLEPYKDYFLDLLDMALLGCLFTVQPHAHALTHTRAVLHTHTHARAQAHTHEHVCACACV
jgi:hypothetical protein